MRRTDFDETFEYKGHQFGMTVERDNDMGEPWKEHHGHGVVTEWTTRDKAPGERVLAEDGGLKRYYDIQATLKTAKLDGWGASEEAISKREVTLGRKLTKGELASLAVEQDFEFMRGWCNDEWWWEGITVTMLDDEEEPTDIQHSLWGIESGNDKYHREVAEELADECISEWNEANEAVIAESHAEYLLFEGKK